MSRDAARAASLLAELKRRRVVRVAGVRGAAAFWSPADRSPGFFGEGRRYDLSPDRGAWIAAPARDSLTHLVRTGGAAAWH